MVRSDRDRFAQLWDADIIYLAETHDSLEDHRAQLEIIQALHQHQGKIAIAMEMFQRPFQEALDRYLNGEITEAQLQVQTEYDQRWGFDWEFYAPILRYAKAHQLPVLALNTPTEISRKVARNGLESLTEAEKQYIPPFAEIRLDNEDYRQQLQGIYELHAGAGHGNSSSFERFFLAQVLWDETMADAIARFWQNNSEYQIIVLAGRGHIQYGYGIPSRVERRLSRTDFVQRSVWLGSFPEGEPQPADLDWKFE
ncbi:MAG: ChaN family lipoprotein [Cyanobacteriota bacterium]|nr:ChaN family lipoprotein [Cyanobacteriota bacterium]